MSPKVVVSAPTPNDRVRTMAVDRARSRRMIRISSPGSPPPLDGHNRANAYNPEEHLAHNVTGDPLAVGRRQLEPIESSVVWRPDEGRDLYRVRSPRSARSSRYPHSRSEERRGADSRTSQRRQS